VVQTAKLGHERWVLENTPVSSKTLEVGGSLSHKGSMHVVWIAQLGVTRVKSLGSHKYPLGLGFPKEIACMTREYLGHPQRFGAQVGTHVAILFEVALQKGEPYALDYTKIG